MASISGLGRFPGERSGKPLQYSCLRNPMDREDWWTTVYGVTKESDTLATKQKQHIMYVAFTKRSLINTLLSGALFNPGNLTLEFQNKLNIYTEQIKYD